MSIDHTGHTILGLAYYTFPGTDWSACRGLSQRHARSVSVLLPKPNHAGYPQPLALKPGSVRGLLKLFYKVIKVRRIRLGAHDSLVQTVLSPSACLRPLQVGPGLVLAYLFGVPVHQQRLGRFRLLRQLA